jgi:LPS export ABC transporter protein LptC/lipopolysaccharide transport protein LptA
MNRLSNWVFAGLLILLFLEILIGFPIKLETVDETQEVKQDLTQLSGADKKMEAVHLVESREGNRDWELFSEKAEGYEGEGSWELKNVKVLFYNRDVVQFTVTGDSGRIDNKTKDMNIEGNVRTVSSNGYKFQTSKVFYSSKERTLTSPESVQMMSPPDKKGKSMLLSGDQMQAIVDESTMTISNNVHAKKTIDNEKEIKISSKGAQFSSRSNMAKFFDQVVIEIDSIRLEGPEASFQYDDGTDFLKSVLIKGGVKMSDYDKFATSEMMRFDPSENKFVLSGNPRVVQNKDEILGDKITFIDGGKKVKVENLRGRMDEQ